jgi:hypothetical protein
MAPNSAEGMLPAGGSPVGRRRTPFQFWPDHPEGVTFGFLFRFLVAVLSVGFGTILMLVVGGILTHWQLTWPLLVVFGMVIVLIIYAGEYFRSAVFERVVSDREASEVQTDETDALMLQGTEKANGGA